jgi:predicted ATP-binding protein involved in virulence
MYLVDLELTNVRAIRQMHVSFRGITPAERTRRWTVLLGENGCGKSTVLKSIGLLLAGSEALSDLIGNPDDWIRNSASMAVLKATLSTAEGEERTVHLEINRGDGRDVVLRHNTAGLSQLDAAIRKADRNYFIAGYGAFRRPPDTSRGRRSYGSAFESRRASQLATMFSSSQDLVSLEQWAMDLDYVTGASGRSVIAEALDKLLPGMTFKDIDKSRRTVVMKTLDGDVPLQQLSEGYQAMAAWAGDLLFRMTETFKDHKNPLDARGVLLIDEMDLHLHPVWKRNLVDFLNSAFPNLQIIATTHSPLSIQQCGEGELFVVRREDTGPTLVAFKGDPSRLRLSELFLSPLIGLATLDSPKVAELRQKARDIELKRGAKTDEDVKTLGEIRSQLEGTVPLIPEEAPAYADLITYQRSVDTGTVAQRIEQAKILFGTTRQAVPAATQRPPAKKPAAANKPTTKKPPAKKSVAQKPVAKKPAAKTPAAKKAAAKRPAAKKPVVRKAAAKKAPARKPALKP